MQYTRRSLLRTGIIGTTLGVVAASGLTIPGAPEVLAASNVQKKLVSTLIGTWKLAVTFPDGTTQTSFVTYGPEENLLLVLSPNPGSGRWEIRGAERFSYHFTELVHYTPPSDSQSPGTCAAYVVSTQMATLRAGGRSYTSSGVAHVYTPVGRLQRTLTTTSVATKVS